jgi:hypothetical protein
MLDAGARWSKVEDGKLVKLLEDNILDPSDMETKTMEQAREDYFPEFRAQTSASLAQ